MMEILREINPGKMEIISVRQPAEDGKLPNNSNKGKRELVTRERTFISLEKKLTVESIRSWRRGKVAKNMEQLLETGAIEILIKKHPENLEKFFENTKTAKLYNLLKENSELKTREIRDILGWGVNRTNRELAKLFNMGLAGRKSEHGKIFLIEQEKKRTQPIEKKTTEKELTPQIEYVLKTPIGMTFSSLEKNLTVESIRSWRKNVVGDMNQLLEKGVIEIEIIKHSENLKLSSQTVHKKISINENTISQKKRGRPKISFADDPEKIRSQRRKFAPDWIKRIKAIREHYLENI